MNLAVCLLAYSAAVTVLGPPVLLRLTRAGAAPRLGVAVWLAALASVLGAWLSATGLFLTQLVDSWGHLGRALTGCLAGLRLIARGGYGPAVQASLLLVAALGGVALIAAGTRTALSLRQSRRHTRAHAQAARLAAVGTLDSPDGALVIDSARPAVYCLAGRPRTIVISRAALTALDGGQLAAVMAHEQAHLNGRHHLLLTLTAALARVLPRVRLFVDGHADIARLLEMCADDAAARQHSRDTLVDALLALTLTPTSSSPTGAPPAPSATRPATRTGTPTGALAAAGTGVARRAQRLLFPPDPTRARLGLTLALAVVLLGPTLATGIAGAVPMPCAL